MKPPLPPCGLYRTTGPVGSIPTGRLVYFHNHGEPGPGLYLPASWTSNRVKLQDRGSLLPSPEDVRWLEPLPPEGFYRVTESFFCCAKRCRSYEPETLVQLGYNAAGEAIVFTPEIVDGMLAVPEQGSRIDHEHFSRLKQLKVPTQERRANVH
jgi:hypothetical protein